MMKMIRKMNIQELLEDFKEMVRENIKLDEKNFFAAMAKEREELRSRFPHDIKASDYAFRLDEMKNELMHVFYDEYIDESEAELSFDSKYHIFNEIQELFEEL